MSEDPDLTGSIYERWHIYQQAMVSVLTPLGPDQLALRVSANLRSVGEIADHIIRSRARWFDSLMGEGGEAFQSLGRWDRRGAGPRGADELVNGLEPTCVNWNLPGWRY